MHPLPAPPLLRLHHLLQPRHLPPRPARLLRRPRHPHRHLVHPPHPRHQPPTHRSPLPPPEKIQIRPLRRSLAPADEITHGAADAFVRRAASELLTPVIPKRRRSASDGKPRNLLYSKLHGPCLWVAQRFSAAIKLISHRRPYAAGIY